LAKTYKMKTTILLLLTSLFASCGKFEKVPVTVKTERDVLMEEYFKQIDSFDYHIDKSFYYSMKVSIKNTEKQNDYYCDKMMRHNKQANFWYDRCRESKNILYP
jgi:hypothetical protein